MEPKPTYSAAFDRLLTEKQPLWRSLADQTMTAAAARHTGTVKWFDRVKGYGFIIPDDGSAEVFVHYSAIQGDGYRNLHEDDRVSYDLVDRGRGPQAQAVRPFGGAA